MEESLGRGTGRFSPEAQVAGLDKGCDVSSHAGPPVRAADQVNGLDTAGVSSGTGGVCSVDDLGTELVVWWHEQPVSIEDTVSRDRAVRFGDPEFFSYSFWPIPYPRVSESGQHVCGERGG